MNEKIDYALNEMRKQRLVNPKILEFQNSCDETAENDKKPNMYEYSRRRGPMGRKRVCTD